MKSREKPIVLCSECRTQVATITIKAKQGQTKVKHKGKRVCAFCHARLVRKPYRDQLFLEYLVNSLGGLEGAKEFQQYLEAEIERREADTGQ